MQICCGILNIYKFMKQKLEKLLSVVCFAVFLIFTLYLSGCAVRTNTKVDVVNRFNHSVKPVVAVLDFQPDVSEKDKNKDKNKNEDKESDKKEEKDGKPFVAGLFNNPDAGNVIANTFSQELSKSELFTVVKRDDVKKALNQLGLVQGISDVKGYFTLGEALGVDALIIGTYKRFGFLYPTIVPRIWIKFYAEYMDLNTKQKIWHIFIKGQSSAVTDERDFARQRINDAIKQLEKKLFTQK